MIWQESIVHGFLRILKVSDIQAVTNELSKQNIRLLEIVITSSVPTGNILVHYTNCQFCLICEKLDCASDVSGVFEFFSERIKQTFKST